jgi:DNA polymerase III alpha subunit
MQILEKMKTTQYSEQVYAEQDLFEFVMQGHCLDNVTNLIVEPELDLEKLAQVLENPNVLATWHYPENQTISIAEFDLKQQSQWFMPDDYRDMDIAEYVLSLCNTQEELQRCGEELLMFQERNLFNLLRYLKYFVDTMQDNHMIWGVGRGSSVASYVLYKLGVHRIDSMFYDLHPQEFLR